MSLDWITDEDSKAEIATEDNGKRGGPRRRWSVLLLLLALLALAIVYVQQLRRLQAQEAALVEEVSAIHRLWKRAVTERDKELFSNLLEKRDSVWYQAQHSLFDAGSLLDRNSLGLHQDSGAEVVTERVEVAPDWQSAIVLTEYLYQVQDGDGTGETVRLSQSALYSRQGNRWRYGPPGEDYWGEPEETVGAGVTVVAPARDADLGSRVQAGLEADLMRLCAAFAEDNPCPPNMHLEIRFSTDPTLLAEPADAALPMLQGEAFLLPAPSLVGRPVDDSGFEALYRGYTEPILEMIRHNLSLPIPLPEQDIATLCFPAGGHSLGLFRYDTQLETWSTEVPERSFRFLSRVPGGDGIILQEHVSEETPSYLRLVWYRLQGEQALFSGVNRQRLARPIGWGGTEGNARLLVYGSELAEADIFYSLVDLSQCDENGCLVSRLAGHTQWSPNGVNTLVSRRDGLWLGDAGGAPLQYLERGSSSFWLDNETYGYVRYDYSTERKTPIAEIVTRKLGDDSATLLISSSDFALEDSGGEFFVNYAGAVSETSSQLLISGPALDPANEDYYIFSLQVAGESGPRLVARLADSLNGQPGTLTPTGYPPFLLSPNGRWLLAASVAEPATAGWTLHLSDLQSGLRRDYEVDYPPYPARYPFTAWSADGEWLTIVGDGYLRLIAPAYDYERLAPHAQDTCFYAAWLNKSVE